MSKVDKTQEDIKFILWTILHEGPDKLRVWYESLDDDSKEYVISLLHIFSHQLIEVSQGLTGNIKDAKNLFDKLR